MQPKG